MKTWWHDSEAGIDEPDNKYWEYGWEEPDAYKRILVAIDQNPWSYDTINHAVALAARSNATLTILMAPTYLIIQEAAVRHEPCRVAGGCGRPGGRLNAGLGRGRC